MADNNEHVEVLTEALTVVTPEDTTDYLLRKIPSGEKLQLEILLAQDSLDQGKRVTLRSFFLSCITDKIKKGEREVLERLS